jgi:RHS repeat-associated protein
LQSTTPLTDFNYGGMFYDADSGLNLTLYRAYDPVAGRWLSRDPTGEPSDAVGNLYSYVGGNPTNNTDPLGLQTGPYAPPPPNIPGGPYWWSPNPQNSRTGEYVDSNNNRASWDPEGHWDCTDSAGRRQRYDWRGNPISPDQAHNPPFPQPRLPPWPRSTIIIAPIPILCATVPAACGIDPNRT